jgi:DNA-binding NarL/FixJ family response regulator
VAAAVLGEPDALAPHLARAHDILTRLGDPPLWSAPLHWSELHAALAAGDRAGAAEHATVLKALAERAPHTRALARAADCLCTGETDPAVIRTAATGLRLAGLDWDGSRLAAEAAARADDRKSAGDLMALARTLSGTTEPESTQDEPVTPMLSERELEVGRLILAGLTHKQIGARLFISAKTVEHHVARMKTRLGADGRNELFGRLRKLLETEPQL